MAFRLRFRIHFPPLPAQGRKRLRCPPLPPLLRKRLVIAGHRHRTVTRLYIGLAAAGAILALLWTLDAPGSGLLIVLGIPVLCWGLWAYVVDCERRRSQGVMRG